LYQTRDIVLPAAEGGERERPVRGDDAAVGGVGERVGLVDERRGLLGLPREQVDSDPGC
jgi:hypothetical protein